MAIANTIFDRGIQGDCHYVKGKSVLSGDVKTGDIATGLSRVDSIHVITAGATAKAVAVNETFPLASGDVTVVTEDNNATVYWKAEGRM